MKIELKTNKQTKTEKMPILLFQNLGPQLFSHHGSLIQLDPKAGLSWGWLMELRDCSSNGEPPRTSSVSCPWKAPPSPCPCRFTYGQTELPAQRAVDCLHLRTQGNCPGVQIAWVVVPTCRLFFRVTPVYQDTPHGMEVWLEFEGGGSRGSGSDKILVSCKHMSPGNRLTCPANLPWQ